MGDMALCCSPWLSCIQSLAFSGTLSQVIILKPILYHSSLDFPFQQIVVHGRKSTQSTFVQGESLSNLTKSTYRQTRKILKLKTFGRSAGILALPKVVYSHLQVNSA